MTLAINLQDSDPGMVACVLEQYLPRVLPPDLPLPPWLISMLFNELDSAICRRVVETGLSPQNAFVRSAFMLSRTDLSLDKLGLSRHDAIRDVMQFAVLYDTCGLEDTINKIAPAADDLVGAFDVVSYELVRAWGMNDQSIPTGTARRVNTLLVQLVGLLESGAALSPELYGKLNLSHVLSLTLWYEHPELRPCITRLMWCWTRQLPAWTGINMDTNTHTPK